jgi:hypothetical protein
MLSGGCGDFACVFSVFTRRAVDAVKRDRIAKGDPSSL